MIETATIKEELDKIILVGGQSKMPLVQKKLQDWFLKKDIHMTVKVCKVGNEIIFKRIMTQAYAKKSSTVLSVNSS